MTSSSLITIGRCSFQLPDGFEIIKEASLIPDAQGATIASLKTPISVTLRQKNTSTSLPEISEDPNDLDPDLFPTTINLTAGQLEQSQDPLSLLEATTHEMAKWLNRFNLRFSEACQIKGAMAGRAEFSFITQFEIKQLTLFWRQGEECVKAFMTLPASKAEVGWKILTRFAESVRL